MQRAWPTERLSVSCICIVRYRRDRRETKNHRKDEFSCGIGFVLRGQCPCCKCNTNQKFSRMHFFLVHFQALDVPEHLQAPARVLHQACQKETNVAEGNSCIFGFKISTNRNSCEALANHKFLFAIRTYRSQSRWLHSWRTRAQVLY